jgi:hypothetical protein
MDASVITALTGLGGATMGGGLMSGARDLARSKGAGEGAMAVAKSASEARHV